MSFVTQEDVFAAVEPVLRGVFEEFGGGKPVTQKFPMIPYREAMLKYGVDKPDLRNPIVIVDVTERVRRLRPCRSRPSRTSSRPAASCARFPHRAPPPAALLLRQAQRLGAGRGRAGPRLHHLRRGRRAARPAAGRSPSSSRRRSRPASSPRPGSRPATPCSSPATSRPRPPSSPARRAPSSATTSA